MTESDGGQKLQGPSFIFKISLWSVCSPKTLTNLCFKIFWNTLHGLRWSKLSQKSSQYKLHSSKTEKLHIYARIDFSECKIIVLDWLMSLNAVMNCTQYGTLSWPIVAQQSFRSELWPAASGRANTSWWYQKGFGSPPVARETGFFWSNIQQPSLLCIWLAVSHPFFRGRNWWYKDKESSVLLTIPRHGNKPWAFPTSE